MIPEDGIPQFEPPKKKSSVAKRLFKALFWSFTVLLLLVLIPFILLFVYEKEIKSAIVTEINTHLKTKV